MEKSKRKCKRVRIMCSIEEAGHWRSTQPEVMETDLTSLSCVDLHHKRCSLKSIPKMSEEMLNVMSSFNMLDVSESDPDILHENEYRDGRRDSTLTEAERTVAYGGIERRASKRDSLSFPTVNQKTRLQKVETVAFRVHSAANIMKARVQKSRANTNREKTKVTRSQSTKECCSPKTKRLLARSATVYGRIESLREDVKLVRSASSQWSTNEPDTPEQEQITALTKENGNVDADSLQMKASNSRDIKSIKQRSLDENSTRNLEDVNQQASGLKMPPLRKLRSVTIS